MPRIVAALFVLVATVLVPPRPAAGADHVLCSGYGTIVTADPFFHPVFFPSTSSEFYLETTIGGCADLPFLDDFVAEGEIKGNCHWFQGEGTTNEFHDFVFASRGTTMFITGDINGVADVQEDVFTAESCISGTTRFFVTFVLWAIDDELPGPGGGTPNSPPGTPTLVSPADNSSFATTDVPVLTVNSSDPDNDSYVAVVELTELTFAITRTVLTPLTSSGSNASTTFANLPPGSYSWRARAIDGRGAQSAWSGANTFTVTLV